MPELWEIGLDPAVQGVPVKKKRSVSGPFSVIFSTIFRHLEANMY